MNALADPRVAEYLNENFISTYLKVGTFQIIQGQKVGGNVASYFCLHDGGVVHAVAGQVAADKLLSESRWAYETRKSALTSSTDLGAGVTDMKKYRDRIKRAHSERYHAEATSWAGIKSLPTMPMSLPRHASQQAQVHWLLASQPLSKLENLYPVVWTQVLNERLSGLPVALRCTSP